ncbi:MAG TPA: cytochrome P450 [Acidimicrobiales bacterium]|nr:cytochrome P450 [Acidimicrobiales bacterium]
MAVDLHYDMYDREIYASPYETYQRLLREAPLYFNDELNFYAVSRSADLTRVLTDRDTFISGKGGVYNFISTGMEMPPGLFIFEDPPLHTVHRNLVSRLFTPRAVNGLEPQIRELCTEVVDSLIDLDQFDFMDDFAMRIPIQVIGMLVGIEKSDQKALLDLVHKNIHEGTADREAQQIEAVLATAAWFNDYLDWREENPSDDVMTQLLNVEFEDDTGTVRKLRRDEALTFLTLIMSAGSDTTATAIGWAGSLLSAHPDQRRELVDDPALIPRAVEEILRYEPPAYHYCRWVAKDVQFHEQTVPADTILVVLPGAANRDEAKFDDPDRFDIHRNPGQIFTFSFGIHFCLGASLARMETKIALETILPRISEWTADLESASLTGGIDTRGWERLPVHV